MGVLRDHPLELDTAAGTVRYLERDWGVQVQADKQEQLAQGLGAGRHVRFHDLAR
jgi:hypothetical protein